MKRQAIVWICCLALPVSVGARQRGAETTLHERIEVLANQIEPKVIEWRRYFHQHPELSNREFKTSERVAEHLRSLGMEVRTGVAHTGVVGLLKGKQPGPVVGLRADMDALPVTERVDVPFASRVKSTYAGREVGVMHACGHDSHVGILMGVASVLSQLRDQLPGTVKFIFQPAEEGPPPGEEGGASMMVREGALESPPVDAIFGLHVWSLEDVGTIGYRSGGLLAAADRLEITVRGRQTHGSQPWKGRDPIVAAAQIINGLQTIISRQTDLTKAAAVISIGSIHGGVRNNIIPEEVRMVGTIRTLDSAMQEKIHQQIQLVATRIAESMGTLAEVKISKGAPVTENDPDLTAEMAPTLRSVAGASNVRVISPITGAEDFAFYVKKVPGLFFFLGGKPLNVAASDAAPHHTPDFFIDESGFKLGVRVLSQLAVDYLEHRSRHD
ncbi:MAG: amidohydrolase [Acidobacteriota bacterium]